jgi:hypothetical protein
MIRPFLGSLSETAPLGDILRSVPWLASTVTCKCLYDKVLFAGVSCAAVAESGPTDPGDDDDDDDDGPGGGRGNIDPDDEDEGEDDEDEDDEDPLWAGVLSSAMRYAAAQQCVV